MLTLLLLLWTAHRPAPDVPTPNPYVGAWEYRTDSTVFRVQLREVRDFLLPDGTRSPYPVLLGCYRFSRGGRVVDETCARPQQGGSPFGFVQPGREMHLVFKDRAGTNHVKIALRPDSVNHDRMRWTRLSQLESVRLNDPGLVRFQLPARFELARVR